MARDRCLQSFGRLWIAKFEIDVDNFTRNIAGVRFCEFWFQDNDGYIFPCIGVHPIINPIDFRAMHMINTYCYSHMLSAKDWKTHRNNQWPNIYYIFLGTILGKYKQFHGIHIFLHILYFGGNLCSYGFDSDVVYVLNRSFSYIFRIWYYSISRSRLFLI